MKKYVVLEKEVGQTPLQVIESYKAENTQYADIPMAYAGRLDPMASGKLLILIGDECKRQKEYHSLDKAYDFEILFGLSSDTGDVLGLAEYTETTSLSDEIIKKAVKSVGNTITLPYPVYSSKTVKGNPLFLWALEDRLDEIEIPTFTSRIFNLAYHGQSKITAIDLKDHIYKKINTIPPVTDESKRLGADFRREEIREQWSNVLDKRQKEIFQIVRFSCVCSSGVYVRSLAPHIASILNTSGLAFSIHRTHIGKYISITRSHGVWIKNY